MAFTSIPDTPCPEKDSFGIHPYAQGLIRFIEGTNTPITIALQGALVQPEEIERVVNFIENTY